MQVCTLYFFLGNRPREIYLILVAVYGRKWREQGSESNIERKSSARSRVLYARLEAGQGDCFEQCWKQECQHWAVSGRWDYWVLIKYSTMCTHGWIVYDLMFVFKNASARWKCLRLTEFLLMFRSSSKRVCCIRTTLTSARRLTTIRLSTTSGISTIS